MKHLEKVYKKISYIKRISIKKKKKLKPITF
jgi:hypothetical protein